MSLRHGFELLVEQEISELRSTARVYRHAKTGARLLSMHNDDENKVFGISFRTPPEDSTGVAHILEHSVLCGSRKYPTKEPFVELIKGSLHTFLNAFTYPDKTCYPVASTNSKDFYNLVDVYLDAVFFPRLTPQVLMQEGWHYESNDANNVPTYKGVVFNEMKGVYSSPESRLSEESQRSLFPDTTYGLDSGGDPAHITDLSFAQFTAFHRDHYHPSNAYTFFWGDDDEDHRLKLCAEYFDQFDGMTSQTQVALQAPFAEPKRVEALFDASDNDNKAMFTSNFCLGEADADSALSLQILQHILIGLPASPLRKTLTDSGLGEDIAGSGLDDEFRQFTFSVGLKGIDDSNIETAKQLIDDTLAGLVRDGIDSADIDAAVNSVEFDLRELNTGSYPQGLSVMLTALQTWLHDGDPLALLPYEQRLARLKQRLQDGERVFEDLIDKHLLKNPHRTVVVLRPDAQLGATLESQERERLEKYYAGLNAEEKQALVEQSQHLQALQEAPDSPEALASIPHLTLADLDRSNRVIPSQQLERSQVPILFHELGTNGIVYLDVCFDLNRLPQKLFQYTPLFGRALVETGTTEQSFVDFSRRIARSTGGIHHQVFLTPRWQSPESSAQLIVRGRATLEHAEDLLALLQDVIGKADLSNVQRLQQIAMENKARLEQHLVPAGHQAVSTRLRARFDVSGYQRELTSGLSQLEFLRQLLERFDNDIAGVQSDLEQLRSALFNRQGMLVNVTADAAAFAAMDKSLTAFINSVPSMDVAAVTFEAPQYAKCEALLAPAQVNFVGQAAHVYRAGYEFSGAAHVVSRALGTTYLWEQVRVQGGAYGAFCVFDRLSGSLSFLSYRDPNVQRTLDTYKGIGDFLRSGRIEGEELERSIIGTIGDMDSHMLPDAKGFTSMARYFSGEDDAFRQQVREQILATSVDDFVRFADAADAVIREGDIVVLGNSETLRASLPEATFTEIK